MCTLALAWHQHPRYPLILAANRDEFYHRPTEAMSLKNDVLAGRDLQSGGLWTGFGLDGRWGILTNVRKPQYFGFQGPSRGEILCNWLTGDESDPLQFCKNRDFSAYSGFNILLGAGNRLLFYSNDSGDLRLLPPGFYGLSNASLDSPWPKLLSLKQHFTEMVSTRPALEPADLIPLLIRPETAEDSLLPSTGLPFVREKQLSALFIETEDYGTRSSTAAIMQLDGTLNVRETRHRSMNPSWDYSDFSLKCPAPPKP